MPDGALVSDFLEPTRAPAPDGLLPVDLPGQRKDEPTRSPAMRPNFSPTDSDGPGSVDGPTSTEAPGESTSENSRGNLPVSGIETLPLAIISAMALVALQG